MKVSYFTPTHNPEWLHDVWACLKRQTIPNWEWVVAANGAKRDAICAVVRQLTGEDPRVKLIAVPDSIPAKVGALKKFTCEQAAGDLFAEYDHDDLITPDCTEEILKAAEKSPKSVFIYSEAVTCDFEHKSHVFSPAYGWHTFQWEYNGRTYTVNRCFEPTPRSLCEILYGPDHIRVWSRDAYLVSGGHDPLLRVCDDHDLVVRTYLKGVEFKAIPKVLYIHRLNPATTSQTSLREIQTLSRANRDKHLMGLTEEWCRRKNLPMYDLGGAHNCPKGYIPIDTVKVAGGIQADVTKGMKFLDDNTVGCFRASDFLEHVPVRAVVPLFNNIWRKLVAGGMFSTFTPAVCDDNGVCGRGAFQDPTHVSYWSSNNFWYYTRASSAKYVPEIKCRFQAVRMGNGYPSDWHKTHLIPYVWADLMAVKSGMIVPGPMEI